MITLFYQLQKNGTKHLVEVENGRFRYLPFHPNLKIPTIKSKKFEKQTQQPMLSL